MKMIDAKHFLGSRCLSRSEDFGEENDRLSFFFLSLFYGISFLLSAVRGSAPFCDDKTTKSESSHSSREF